MEREGRNYGDMYTFIDRAILSMHLREGTLVSGIWTGIHADATCLVVCNFAKAFGNPTRRNKHESSRVELYSEWTYISLILYDASSFIRVTFVAFDAPRIE